jgi:hypothetical protein
MNRFFTYCCLWLVVSSIKSQEQSAPAHEPSLAETEKWIEQTFHDGRRQGHKALPEINFDSPNNDRCYMSVYFWEGWGSKREGKLRFYDYVNLADIDPTSIKASATIQDKATFDEPLLGETPPYVWLQIRTANDADKVLDHLEPLTDEDKGQNTKTHFLGFFDEGIPVGPDYAPRFISALRRAVELCGGRPSTF